MSFAYSGFLEAARISDGFVVASWGLYLPMATVICQLTACIATPNPRRYILAKSPESHTTTYQQQSAYHRACIMESEHTVPVALS